MLHEGVAHRPKVSAILEFLHEQVGDIEVAHNVPHDNVAKGNGLANKVLSEIQVLHALGHGGLGPVNSCMVVVAEDGGR